MKGCKKKAEIVAPSIHTGYIYILHRTEGGRKKTTTENQRFSVVFYGLMNPLVIRVGLCTQAVFLWVSTR